jgi:hypothetical protein
MDKSFAKIGGFYREQRIRNACRIFPRRKEI